MAEDEELGSWEELEDDGVLDRRLNELTIGLQNNEEKKNQLASSRPPNSMVMVDTGHTPYQPQVRILRREAPTTSSPTQNNHNGTASPSRAKGAASKHGKSLQQREAEYAEARLRIFGSLPPEDSDEETEKPNAAENSIPVKGAPIVMKPDPSSPQVQILRQPRGPDGSQGFGKQDLT